MTANIFTIRGAFERYVGERGRFIATERASTLPVAEQWARAMELDGMAVEIKQAGKGIIYTSERGYI